MNYFSPTSNICKYKYMFLCDAYMHHKKNIRGSHSSSELYATLFIISVLLVNILVLD